MTVKPVWQVIKDAGAAWVEDSAPRLGAALSYYTIFALSPLLVIAIFVASLWFNRADAQAALFEQLQGLVGSRGADVLQSALKASVPREQGIIASIIAGATLVLTSTGLFAELQGALNAIWGVEPKPGHSVRSFFVTRMLSFGMVLGIGFLLIVSLIVSALVTALSGYLSELVPGMDIFWTIINTLVSLGIITLLFAMIFKILPDIEIAWRDVWVGAVVTGILFTIGKSLLGIYLGRSTAVSAYGAAGSVVLILLWVYYSSQILFFGAEVTQVYACRYGRRLKPKPHAQWVDPEEAPAAGRPRGKVAPGQDATPAQRQERLLRELRRQVEAMKRRRAELLGPRLATASRGHSAGRL